MSENTQNPVKTPELHRHTVHKTKDFSVPYITQTIAIYSEEGKRLFTRLYDRTNKSQSVVLGVLTNFATKDKQEEYEKTLNRHYGNAVDSINQTVATLKKYQDEAGISEDEQLANFTNGSSYKVQTLTKFSKKLVDLFVQYDKLVARIEAMWLMGMIDNEARQVTKRRTEARIRTYCRATEQYRFRIQQQGKRKTTRDERRGQSSTPVKNEEPLPVNVEEVTKQAQSETDNVVEAVQGGETNVPSNP